MNFTSPKHKGRTLKQIIEMVDEVKEWGFNAICMGIPYHGGIQYSGLDVLDYYAVDPALGTMDDFDELVTACHDRDIAVMAFLNLGYAATEFPPFIQACDDVKAGVDSPESRWFVWSDTKSAELDRSQVPFFPK
jgi:glycosidase